MYRKGLFALVLAGFLVACEEGPDQIFTPLPDNYDKVLVNGFKAGGFVAEGKQPFEFELSEKDEDVPTTVVCEADKLAAVWSKMIKEPIVPTIGAGGLDLRGEPLWSMLSVDDAQSEDMLCQATVAASYIVYWGDNAELVAFFDEKTRLIEGLVLLPGYEGIAKFGEYELQLNQPILKDGNKLNNPASDDNMRALNRAMLKAFRPEVKDADQRDCIESNTCYAYDWQELKVLAFQDLAFYLIIEPFGEKATQIEMYVKRAFDFCNTDVIFEQSGGTLAPIPKIPTSTSCNPTLGSSWAEIEKCMGGESPAKARSQPGGNAELIDVDMGGLSLSLKRPSLKYDEIFPDDIKPEKGDTIASMSFGIDYEGEINIPWGNFLSAYFDDVLTKVTELVPEMTNSTLTTADDPPVTITAAEALGTRLKTIVPAGDPDKFRLGTQKVLECPTPESCVEGTLLAHTQQVVNTAITTAGAVVPDELKVPVFYAEAYMRNLMMVFNDNKKPEASQLYFYPNNEAIDVLYAVFAREYNGEWYAVRTGYHTKADQLFYLFFKKTPMRTEAALWKDAEAFQYDGKPGDGIFRAWNFARSARLGLGTQLKVSKVLPELRRATLTLKLGPLAEDVLVSFSPQGDQSGYSIPLKGQISKFEPAAFFGFSGNVIAGAIWAKDTIVRAVSSGSFFDKVELCGVKVGLWEPVYDFLAKLPPQCEKLLTYSENGKFLYYISGYVTEDPFKIGLSLEVTADRISRATYWAEL